MELLWDGNGGTPRKDMGPVEILWDGDGVSLGVWKKKQTENITLPHTTDAGGNNLQVFFKISLKPKTFFAFQRSRFYLLN